MIPPERAVYKAARDGLPMPAVHERCRGVYQEYYETIRAAFSGLPMPETSAHQRESLTRAYSQIRGQR